MKYWFSIQAQKWGIADAQSSAVTWRDPWNDEVASLFAPVMDMACPVLLNTTMPGAPVFLAAVLADVAYGEDEGALKLTAGGQGASWPAAVLSAAGELAERLSLWSLGADDPRVYASINRAAQPEVNGSVSMGKLLGFSRQQEQDLCQNYAALNRLWDGQKINWNQLEQRCVLVTDLSDGARYAVPAYGVLMGEGRGLGLSGLSLTSTSGTAVWSDKQEALRRAVHEIVERDSIARAWYNRLWITRLEEPFYSQFIHINEANYLKDRERRTSIFSVETGFKTYVALTISQDRDGFGACAGSATARTFADAVRSALHEMFQAERSLSLMEQNAQKADPSAEVPFTLRYARSVRIDEDWQLAGVPQTDPGTLDAEFGSDELVESCLGQGIRLYAFDATRPDIQVPCMKVLSPDLCSWQPRFGKARLYSGLSSSEDGKGYDPRDWEEGTPARAVREAAFARRPFPFL